MSSAGRRATALTLDLLLALGLTLLLAESSGHWLSQRAVSALAIDDPTGPWRGPLPLVLGAVGSISYGLPLSFTLITASEVFFAQSPGKALLGLRVGRMGPLRRTGRLLLRDAPWHLALAALVVGDPGFTVVALVLAGAWALAALAAALLRRHPLHDLVGGPPQRAGRDASVDQRA